MDFKTPIKKNANQLNWGWKRQTVCVYNTNEDSHCWFNLDLISVLLILQIGSWHEILFGNWHPVVWYEIHHLKFFHSKKHYKMKKHLQLVGAWEKTTKKISRKYAKRRSRTLSKLAYHNLFIQQHFGLMTFIRYTQFTTSSHLHTITYNYNSHWKYKAIKIKTVQYNL